MAAKRSRWEDSRRFLEADEESEGREGGSHGASEGEEQREDERDSPAREQGERRAEKKGSPGPSLEDGDHAPGASQAKEHAPGESQAKEHAPGESQAKEHAPGESQTKEHAPGVSQAKEQGPGVSQAEEQAPGVSQTKEQGTSGGAAESRGGGVSQAGEQGPSGAEGAGISQAGGQGPGVNLFANDGSFLELFKRKMEAAQEPELTPEPPAEEPERKRSALSGFVGKRRGGTKLALKTGVVAKKQKAEDEISSRGGAWAQYMAEVKKYKAHQCSDDDKTRPLVK